MAFQVRIGRVTASDPNGVRCWLARIVACTLEYTQHGGSRHRHPPQALVEGPWSKGLARSRTTMRKSDSQHVYTEPGKYPFASASASNSRPTEWGKTTVYEALLDVELCDPHSRRLFD